jgi:hypothetical protein
MDDRNLANWVGGVALGLVLAAVAWLLLVPGPGAGGGRDQVRASERRVSQAWDPNRPPEHQMQRCVDAAAARALTGCLVAAYVRPVQPTPSAVPRALRPSRPVAVVVTPPPTHVPASAGPVNLPPATVPPSAPPPPAPTRQTSARNGPVPGGNTGPPHAGPRP